MFTNYKEFENAYEISNSNRRDPRKSQYPGRWFEFADLLTYFAYYKFSSTDYYLKAGVSCLLKNPAFCNESIEEKLVKLSLFTVFWTAGWVLSYYYSKCKDVKLNKK